jgi:Protein of unknown function (DUF3500)
VQGKKKLSEIHLNVRQKTGTIVGRKLESNLRMAEAAFNLLASLSPGQKERVLFPVTGEERLNWHYVPRERKGVSFKELDGSQSKLVHALISTGLSQEGYRKAMTIMGLETTLKEIEGPTRRFERDPDLYFISLFGTPSKVSPWGWRLEGHHISLNFLIINGKQIASTPNFFGANPAEVPAGYPLAGLRTLRAEEDLARDLLASLDPAQCSRTIIEAEAPADIITRADAHVTMDSPSGLSAKEMTQRQHLILFTLIREYLSRMPEDIAGRQMEQIEKEGARYVHFAWAGSQERRRPHYYRIHGPSFLVEYDNTQNEANHIHSVWRDLRNDWGEDSITRHYQESHGSPRAKPMVPP